MDKEKIIKEINKLNLDKTEFWVLGSSSLVLRGITDQANDIDLAITKNLYNELIKNHELIYLGINHESTWYKINDKIECCIEEIDNKKIELAEPFNLIDLKYYYDNFIKESTREKDKKKKELLENILFNNGVIKMNYKKMREYTHEEFVNLVLSLNEEQLLELSKNYGGYPVLFRMALDDRISHIPFIQTGAAIIIRNEKGQILLQERTDRNKWGLPGGCQDLGEDLRDTAAREAYEETGIKLDQKNIKLIDTLSGEFRKNSYPNGDIVYNNTSLYLADVTIEDASKLKGDSETKRLQFFNPEDIPNNLMDADLIKSYLKYID